jgi:hypothetical protein
MNLRRIPVTVCGPALDFVPFGSEERAEAHIRKHVLDPSERWETILPREAIEAARRGAPEALEELSGGYLREIAEGARFGASFPCHLHGALAPSEPPWYAFLSRRGVRIFASGGRIRTAYRTALRKGGHTDYAYFARAWFDFFARASGKACFAAPAPPNVVSWRALPEATP